MEIPPLQSGCEGYLALTAASRCSHFCPVAASIIHEDGLALQAGIHFALWGQGGQGFCRKQLLSSMLWDIVHPMWHRIATGFDDYSFSLALPTFDEKLCGEWGSEIKGNPCSSLVYQCFSEKGQPLNISSFVSHLVSIAMLQLCSCRMKSYVTVEWNRMQL